MSLIILLGIVYTGSESLQDWLRDMNLWNNLGFSLCSTIFVCCLVAISDGKKKSEMRVRTNWYITVKHWRLSSIRIIFVNY